MKIVTIEVFGIDKANGSKWKQKKCHHFHPSPTASEARQTRKSAMTEWRTLLREARRLETQIDTKMSSLSKVLSRLRQSSHSIALTITPSTPPAATAPTSQSARHRATASHSSTNDAPSFHNDASDDANASVSLQSDLQALLAEFSDVTSDMLRFVESPPSSGAAVPSAGSASVAKRYDSLCRDFQAEFEHTVQSIEKIEQRKQLLGDAGGDRSGRSGGEAMDHLLNEHERLLGIHRTTDELLAVSSETQESLVRQGSVLARLRGQMGELNQRFPGIQDLMTRIRRYKQRDTIVLATVIAFCIIFTLWYWSTK